MMNNMLPPPYQSSLMSLDLNIQDHNHEDQLSSPNSSISSFSSLSSSSSYPILLDQPHQVQQPSFYFQTNHSPNDYQEVEKINMVSSGSWDNNNSTAENHEIIKSKHKLTIRWKKEGINNNNIEEEVDHHDDDDDGTSVKWMSSKMRMMRKMIVSDQTSGGSSNIIASNSKQKFEDQKQPLSPLGSSTNNYSNQIRVCSDCNTTKTPLWRSGPRGPKSLCNACGIRQRKARRALALAAASANGTTVTADQTSSVKRKKLQKKKENKSKIDYCSTHLKKKTKFESEEPSHHHQSKKEFITFEDLRLSLSKNLSVQQVFPQDEKEEAAILLMALSYGLVHG